MCFIVHVAPGGSAAAVYVAERHAKETLRLVHNKSSLRVHPLELYSR